MESPGSRGVGFPGEGREERPVHVGEGPRGGSCEGGGEGVGGGADGGRVGVSVSGKGRDSDRLSQAPVPTVPLSSLQNTDTQQSAS